MATSALTVDVQMQARKEGSSSADSSPDASQHGRDDDNPLGAILAKNRAWSEAKRKEDPQYFSRLLQQQAPQFLWIGCADSRVPANVILGLDPGEVFVQRNVGNQASHTDLNCMSCLEYSVKELKVKHVVVCGHYGCGAVKAALQLPSKSQGLVNCWISDIRECRNQHRDDLIHIKDLSAQTDRLCEFNVLRQMFHVCTSPIMQAAWDRGQDVRVYGLIYSLRDGLIKKLAGPFSGNDDFEQDLAVFAETCMNKPASSNANGTSNAPNGSPFGAAAAAAVPMGMPARNDCGAQQPSRFNRESSFDHQAFLSGTTPRTATARMDELHAFINTKKVNKKVSEHVGWNPAAQAGTH